MWDSKRQKSACPFGSGEVLGPHWSWKSQDQRDRWRLFTQTTGPNFWVFLAVDHINNMKQGTNYQVRRLTQAPVKLFTHRALIGWLFAHCTGASCFQRCTITNNFQVSCRYTRRLQTRWFKGEGAQTTLEENLYNTFKRVECLSRKLPRMSSTVSQLTISVEVVLMKQRLD